MIGDTTIGTTIMMTITFCMEAHTTTLTILMITTIMAIIMDTTTTIILIHY